MGVVLDVIRAGGFGMWAHRLVQQLNWAMLLKGLTRLPSPPNICANWDILVRAYFACSY